MTSKHLSLCQLATVGHQPCSLNKRSLQIGGSYNRVAAGHLNIPASNPEIISQKLY